jgi:hypothetical protein
MLSDEERSIYEGVASMGLTIVKLRGEIDMLKLRLEISERTRQRQKEENIGIPQGEAEEWPGHDAIPF